MSKSNFELVLTVVDIYGKPLLNTSWKNCDELRGYIDNVNWIKLHFLLSLLFCFFNSLLRSYVPLCDFNSVI